MTKHQNLHDLAMQRAEELGFLPGSGPGEHVWDCCPGPQHDECPLPVIMYHPAGSAFCETHSAVNVSIFEQLVLEAQSQQTPAIIKAGVGVLIAFGLATLTLSILLLINPTTALAIRTAAVATIGYIATYTLSMFAGDHPPQE